MKFGQQYLKKSDERDVLNWAEREKTVIIEELSRTGDFARIMSGRDWHYAKRGLSEQPLCASWLNINPPKGFNILGVTKGEVVLLDDNRRPLTVGPKPHSFARNQNGYVVCLTFGQFFRDQHPEILRNITGPGDIIRYYQDQAPELIFPLDEDRHIFMLYAKIEEIRRDLGLWYRRKPILP